MLSAAEALERLKAGNRRFVEEQGQREASLGRARRDELVEGQHPFAVILGCSDSRVPAELIFDQGLGDLFVIRVAGNVVAPSLIGSVEFAASQFGTPLVVVLGHSNCGAVSATLDELDSPSGVGSPNLMSIVERIRPAIETLLETGEAQPREKILPLAVRANIRASANHLRHGSRILETLIERGELVVVSAEYSLATGQVEFFDRLPRSDDEE